MATATSETANRTRKSAYTGKDLDIGAPVRVSRLDTALHYRAEVGRLYREARRREGKYPDATTALKLSQILAVGSKLMEVEALLRIEEKLSQAPSDPRVIDSVASSVTERPMALVKRHAMA